jgi:uroporphyrinogen III methyltransferase / synthase
MPRAPHADPRNPHPLAGRRIVVTRARDQAGALARALAALGAEVVLAPTIRVVPLADLAPLGAALSGPVPYDWIVFTSRNSVQIVCAELPAWGLSAADLGRARVAAIGPGTADALARAGVAPALVPERFVAEAVVAALAARGTLRGQRVLLPRARVARDALPDGLRAAGAVVDVIPVYETVREPGDGRALATALLAGEIDVVTFTSSSTVRGFAELVGPAAGSGQFAAAVIGPVTATTARELGMRVAVEAEVYTVPGLVDALARHFARRPPGSHER